RRCLRVEDLGDVRVVYQGERLRFGLEARKSWYAHDYLPFRANGAGNVYFFTFAAFRVVISTTCFAGLSGSGPSSHTNFWSVSDGSFTVVTGFAFRTRAVRISATV